MSPDRCILSHNYLYLPQALNGRLQPEEWRPLIASAVLQLELVKQKQLPRNFVLWFLVAYAIVIGSIIAAILVSQGLRIGPVPEPVEDAVGWMIILLLFSTGLLLRLSSNRGRRLEADTQAADHTGREKLLQTLMRIGSFGFETHTSRIRTLFSSWPTLSQRIKNLEAAQSPPQPKTKKDEFAAFRKNWGPKS